jgi:gliding motility-associated-like protein
LYVYNEPEGFCKSDIVQVRYRVKENTPTPKVNDYIDCVDPEAEEVLLKTRVKNESDYKYLVFKDESGQEVRVFDPSQVGKTTYTLVAYKDEIGTCPSESVELLVKIKDYAVAGNIAADGAEICPGADVTLSAETQFDETQTNVVIRWYSDPNLSKESLLATDDDYDMEKVLTDTYVYVTVETNNYCENQAGDAKDVYVAMKQASPELSITPKEQVITIGGKPSFVVTPNYVGQAAEYSVYVNDVQVESLADYKPYIDSEYIIVFEGECGTTADSANVTVQWPTVFTPYEVDGLNDTFVKDMEPNFHTAIYNRFGVPLIETENGWDGKLPNENLAVPGVYYYVVTLPDGNVKKGTIEVFKK